MHLKKLTSFLTLFTSLSTLLCCALPAAFVLLGFGAAFAGLMTKFPQLIWLSENKYFVFSFGAVMLVVAGGLQFRARQASCPVDASLREICLSTRDRSYWLYVVSVSVYLVGFLFAFAAPTLLSF